MRLLQKYPKFRNTIMDLDPAIVDISEVSNWYYAELFHHKWELHTDLDRLTPPKQITYMEFRAPATYNDPLLNNLNIGCVVSCHEIDEDKRPFTLYDYTLERILADSMWLPGKEKEFALNDLINKRQWSLKQEELTDKTLWPRFMLFASIFIDIPNDQEPHSLGFLGAYLTDDGRLGWRVNGEENTTVVFHGTALEGYITKISAGYNQEKKDELTALFAKYIALKFIPFGLALSLMNCKNVHITEDQSHPSRQMLRKQARQKTPPVVYKWLSVGGIKKQADQDGTASGNKRQTRLHMVRSHWATYTADAPLFGRYTGTFFKPSFVKGSATVGQVVKGYSVTTPPTPPSPATSPHI